MALNNTVPTLESMLEFQEVYLRAIALSWKDAEFRQALLSDPFDALGRYFDYQCPWLLDLKVTDPGPDFGWDAGTQRWELPENAMTFGVPTRPLPAAEEAVALSVYNDAGPSYLFTCC
ncbi:BMA_0021/BMA_0022 family TOMM bacteriocin [Paraburkholderia sp.]|uniref:BMA_0021/BMA_0022 family TOMM bacteriocin n=1 Tax=Paraburkholderia sp. TaxID=1926495 RepID=UPI003D6ECE0D